MIFQYILSAIFSFLYTINFNFLFSNQLQTENLEFQKSNKKKGLKCERGERNLY